MTYREPWNKPIPDYAAFCALPADDRSRIAEVGYCARKRALRIIGICKLDMFGKRRTVPYYGPGGDRSLRQASHACVLMSIVKMHSGELPGCPNEENFAKACAFADLGRRINTARNLLAKGSKV